VFILTLDAGMSRVEPFYLLSGEVRDGRSSEIRCEPSVLISDLVRETRNIFPYLSRRYAPSIS
jgi:hypothetical protein